MVLSASVPRLLPVTARSPTTYGSSLFSMIMVVPEEDDAVRVRMLAADAAAVDVAYDVVVVVAEFDVSRSLALAFSCSTAPVLRNEEHDDCRGTTG